jgi:hypothetical protein
MSTIKLKSGKEIYANHGIIGITPKGEDREYFLLTEGYDGDIELSYYGDDGEYHPKYTKEELLEIGGIMIRRWLEFIDDVMDEKII